MAWQHFGANVHVVGLRTRQEGFRLDIITELAFLGPDRDIVEITTLVL